MLGEAHSWASLHIGDSMDILKFIVENQSILPDVTALLADHNRLIRELALWVSQGNAGKDPERKEYLGIYAEEVQSKINWAYQTAKEVWEDKYGSGEARRAALGADYDLVQFWVERTKPSYYISGMPKVETDQNGKRYFVKNFPTSKGNRTIYAFPQGKQGDYYNFPGSGCGMCAAASAIYSIKWYNMTLKEYADKNLSAVGGTKCPISTAIIERLLKREGITFKRVKSFDTDRLAEIVRNHLSSGNPVLVSLTRKNRAGVDHKGRYAGSEHYAILWGVEADGKRAFIFDSSRDPNRKPRLVDLRDLCDHVPTAKERENFSPIWNGWSNCGGYVKIK
jgi:hypothetical protein